MALKDAFLPEFDHEMGTTRRLLERAPESAFAWQPHEKSMTLGQLAGHIANIPRWCGAIFDVAEFDLAQADDGFRETTPPASRAELLADFDRKVADARTKLVAQTDSQMLVTWTFKDNGQEIFTMPKVSVFRSFILNHLIHHRGQLSVYLRMNNVPLPSIYGPTADEQ
jgi:uncharacterized damage-inducible protein DinB